MPRLAYNSGLVVVTQRTLVVPEGLQNLSSLTFIVEAATGCGPPDDIDASQLNLLMQAIRTYMFTILNNKQYTTPQGTINSVISDHRYLSVPVRSSF